MEEYVIGEPDYRTYARQCRRYSRRLSDTDRAFIEAIKSPDDLNERDKERLCVVFATLESALLCKENERSIYGAF